MKVKAISGRLHRTGGGSRPLLVVVGELKAETLPFSSVIPIRMGMTCPVRTGTLGPGRRNRVKSGGRGLPDIERPLRRADVFFNPSAEQMARKNWSPSGILPVVRVQLAPSW